jgi:hypothetical protein
MTPYRPPGNGWFRPLGQGLRKARFPASRRDAGRFPRPATNGTVRLSPKPKPGGFPPTQQASLGPATLRPTDPDARRHR